MVLTILRTAGAICDTNRRGYSWRYLSVVLPKIGSTTDKNPEGNRVIIRINMHRGGEQKPPHGPLGVG